MSVATSTAIAIGVAGATAASTAYAAHRQGQAAEQATQAQSTAANEALDFQKGVYATQQRNFQPYRQAGELSLQRLNSLSGQPSVIRNPNGSYSAPTSPTPTLPPPDGTTGATGPAQTVLMQAPTGEQKAVPKDQVPYWQSKGATVIAHG